MITYDEVPILQVRVPTIVSRSKGIQLYDTDNLYPQRCEEAIKRSYTLRSVVTSIADFLNGEGFVDPVLAKLVVNREGLYGETLNKILGKVSKTFSRYETVCLHIGYDMNCRISSITYVPFDYIRLGAPCEDEDKTGVVEKLFYCTNWEGSGVRESGKRPEIIEYDTYNNDPDVIQNQIDAAGGIEFYKGQLLYMTPDFFQYPTATFDPILDHAQTQAELGKFKLGYTQNGFMATMVAIYPGEFESEAEKKEYQKMIKDRKGARNANKSIGIQDKSGTRKVSDLFASLQPANLDRLFELTESSAIKAIVENEGWPKALLGIQENGVLFNKVVIEESYIYANAKTRNRRKLLSEIFSNLLLSWNKPIQSPADIAEQQFVTSGTSVVVPAVNETPVKDGNPAPAAVNDNLKNLTPKQLQSLLRIRRLYRKPVEDSNHIDEAMAVDMLKQSLGIDEVTAKLYLGIQEEESEVVSMYLKLKA